MRQLIAVIGAGGQLGDAMAARLAAHHEVVGLTRDDLDITSATAVSRILTAVCPDVIVNCAAYTNVDAADDHPQTALATNALAVRSLARVAGTIDATLVHFSTDFVFDGHTDRPYVESDAPNPRGTYAMSKLLGDWFAAEVPRHLVLRVESLFGGDRRRSSVDRIAEGIRAGRDVRAFSDRTVSPSYVEDVVEATTTLLACQDAAGLYHCVNTGWTTWADLAKEVARLLGRPDARIHAVPMADVELRAPRPLFAALSNARLRAAGIDMPTWQNALARYLG